MSKNKSVITKELALLEVEKWLDNKKVRSSEREAKNENIEALADAICDGCLIVNEDFTITQKLIFPLGSETKTEEFVFKPRVRQDAIDNAMQGIKATNVRGVIGAYIAALTNQPRALVTSMDTEDFKIAQNIVNFFI